MSTERSREQVEALDQAASDILLGNLDAAETALAAQLARQPGNVSANTGLALVAMKRGAHDSVVNHLAAAVESLPHDRDLIEWILATFGENGVDQIVILNQVFERQPKSTAVLLALVLLSVQAESAETQKWIDCLQRIEPDAADAWINRAIAVALGGDEPGSLVEYGRGIAAFPESASLYAFRGDAFEALADYPAALEDFGKASALAPDLALAERRRAQIYVLMNDPTRAEAAYQQAIRRDARDDESYRGLGALYESQAKWEQALSVYGQILELVPDDPVAHLRCAEVLTALERYREALGEFQRVAELAPDASIGPRRMADTYTLLNDYQQATAAYQRAIAREDGDADAHIGLGLVLEAEGNYDGARGEYERVIELAPESAAGYFNLGNVHLALERYDEALADFSKAAELAPTDALPLRRCGDVQLSRGASQDALIWYQRALALQPDDAELINACGVARESLGSYREALSDYDSAIRLRPEDALFHSNRGSVLVSLAAYDWAVEAYDTAIRLDDTLQAAYQGKADACRLWADAISVPGRIAEGLAAATKATELDPKDQAAIAIRAVMLSKLGHQAEAIAEFNRSLEIDAGYAWARKEKGKALYFAGDLEQAFEIFTRIVETDEEFQVEARIARALIRRRLGRTEEPTHTSEADGDSEPTAETFVQVGRAFVELRALEEALAEFRKAIELDPRYAEAHNALAWYQAIEVGRDLASSGVHASLAVDLALDASSRGNFLDTLGWIWYKRGELEEAQQCLEEAVRLAEPDVVIRHHLEVVADARGRLSRAPT